MNLKPKNLKAKRAISGTRKIQDPLGRYWGRDFDAAFKAQAERQKLKLTPNK